MRRVPVVFALLALCAAKAPAIEMFTYFGDGSRIGLPSLEVPIEAYPGIPLRSDRLRARRRAMRTGAPVRVGPGTPMGGVTIRPMQAPTMPAPIAHPVREPAVRTRGRAATSAADDPAMPPEPESIAVPQPADTEPPAARATEDEGPSPINAASRPTAN